MPYLERPGARVYYSDCGEGPLVITTHGLLETSSYWEVSGIAGRIGLRRRVASVDLRGHGLTAASGGAPGFDVATVGADFGAVADHLGHQRFHLVSHATGGMAAVRYAMEHGERLLSLTLTDTSSQTVFGDPAGYEALASIFESGGWPELHEALEPAIGVFLFRIDAHPEGERIRALVRAMYERNDPATMAAFVRGFYTDPDPRVEGLRAIPCPTLVLVGEYDKALLKPSRLMAAEIPGAELVVVSDVGHMTALEAPAATADAVLGFLDRAGG